MKKTSRRRREGGQRWSSRRVARRSGGVTHSPFDPHLIADKHLDDRTQPFGVTHSVHQRPVKIRLTQSSARYFVRSIVIWGRFLRLRRQRENKVVAQGNQEPSSSGSIAALAEGFEVSGAARCHPCDLRNPCDRHVIAHVRNRSVELSSFMNMQRGADGCFQLVRMTI